MRLLLSRFSDQRWNISTDERGPAWHYKEYQREQSANDRKLYEAAERDASRLLKYSLRQRSN